MPISLKVVSYKNLPLPNSPEVQIDKLGGSIGRKPGNTLVLPDSENFVSGNHAEIIYQEGRYLIKDTSKNGTYLTLAALNLNNNEATLQDNELIRIGEYEVRVSLITEPSKSMGFENLSPSPFLNQPEFAFKPSVIDEPLNVVLPRDIPPSPFNDRPPASPFHDSFTAPDVYTVDPESKDIADFLKDLDSIASFTAPSDELPFDTFPELGPERDNFNLSTPTAAVEQSARPSGAITEISDKRLLPEIFSGSTAAAPTPNSPSPDSVLMQMFLEGAGIPDQTFLKPEQWASMMKASGMLFRNMIVGLMEVLRSRAEMKSEFRVSVTTIRSFDNNPLKFNPDIDSVLKLILAGNNPAFINPKDAIEEAFQDIKFHQIAMTAGIQAALTEILRRFEPEAIEKNIGEGIVFQRKARCWELYCEKYPELKALATEGFFGEEFAEAYEKQMSLLERR